jgi:acylphosphatase
MITEPLGDIVKRVHIIYSGRVQGVGFRFTFREIALRLGVKGYVRNLPDGTVEAVCESSKDVLDLLVKNVSCAMSYYITSANITIMPYTGEFKAFSILV